MIREEKEKRLIEAVIRYLNGEGRAVDWAAWIGIHRKNFYRWVRKYQAEGIAGLKHEFGKRYIVKNPVYPTELKVKAVQAYLSGEGSQEVICRKLGIRSKHTLQNWIKVYNRGGYLSSVKHSGGGSYMKQGRETTQAERIEIAKACIASGKNYGEIALKYQVSYQQVRSWTLKFEKEGASGLEDRRGKRKKDQEPRNELEEAKIEIERLKHQLYLSEMENYLLKKAKEIERRDASAK